VNDPVGRVLEEREALESGFGRSLGVSLAAHLVLVGGAFGAQLLLPRPPPLQVQEGFVVPLPPGGGGTPTAELPAPGPAAPEAPAPPVEPPPKVLKPPKDEPRAKGLPAPDAKPGKAKPTPAPSRGGVAGGTGSQTPGLEFGPPGPGVPGGTDLMGDWYMASVQRKIWLLWTQQLKAGLRQPVAVAFTILADGSVGDIRVEQSSGAFLLDLAAQRAISNAAPFGPLPKDYGTNRITIRAIFKPTS
jgi:TonB family protein